MDLHSIPKTKDGGVVPWGFGKYQHARLQNNYKCVVLCVSVYVPVFPSSAADLAV